MVAAGGPLLEHANPTWAPWQLLTLVRAAVTVGRLEDAQRWAEAAAQRARTLGLASAQARASCAAAEVDLAHGDAKRAATAALEAVEHARRAGSRLDELSALLLAGRALTTAGDRDAAIGLLRETAAQATRGGALRTRDQAARELRRLGSSLGARARRAGAGGTRDLTQREHEVAGMVAAGHANKQIAAALFLSEKTVEHHLSRAYEKLGVRSRAAVAHALAETAAPTP